MFVRMVWKYVVNTKNARPVLGCLLLLIVAALAVYWSIMEIASLATP